MDRKEPREVENLDAFLQEMTALAIKHGIGIAGNPELFVMDWEDRACRLRRRQSFDFL